MVEQQFSKLLAGVRFSRPALVSANGFRILTEST